MTIYYRSVFSKAYDSITVNRIFVPIVKYYLEHKTYNIGYGATAPLYKVFTKNLDI